VIFSPFVSIASPGRQAPAESPPNSYTARPIRAHPNNRRERKERKERGESKLVSYYLSGLRVLSGEFLGLALRAVC